MAIQQLLAGYGGGGGGGPGVHRYWRINITANDGSGSFIGLAEFRFRNAGGTDLTTGPGTGVTGSSEINSSNRPGLAVDNNTTGSGWLSATATPPQWIQADLVATFGSAQEVKTVNIYGSWNVPSASPSAFGIQWSDDNLAWTTAASFSGQTGWTASQLRTFNVF